MRMSVENRPNASQRAHIIFQNHSHCNKSDFREDYGRIRSEYGLGGAEITFNKSYIQIKNEYI